jgi:hypothetical protein
MLVKWDSRHEKAPRLNFLVVTVPIFEEPELQCIAALLLFPQPEPA